jgi:mono/diheme cytochrome c family protein
MNYPVWDVPAPGLLIAAVAILHVFVSHFAVGGGLFLVLAEKKARREADDALLAFVRALSRGFVLLTLVFGALTGVGIWLTIGLVQPQATSALVTTFVWAWAIEWTFFAVEIAAALVYVYGWDRLDARRHVAVGWIYFAASWASLVAISGILSFMLTSGAWPVTRGVADAWWNPSCGPMIALRTAAAAFLAGLYALFAASFVKDVELKARIARWSATRWIAPAGAAAALALAWSLAAASAAGVDVAETLGARSAAPVALLSAVFSAGHGGHPIVRGAARAALAGSAALVVLALAVGVLRARRYGRLEAAALMALGLLCLGSAEWVREGLRKPWVIDRHLFVNGVRVGRAGAGPDPFSLEALEARGVLAAARFARVPAEWRPGDPSFDGLPLERRAAVEADAGREVFRLECSACHTEAGHLGIRRLVAGRGVAAITAVLDAAALPRTPSGGPGAWSDPRVRVATWLGRRMPPFAGTAAEKHALAVHLARLGGDPRAGLEPPSLPATDGAAAFEQHCAMCHGPDSEWPIGPRLHGRSAAELHDLIGRLPQVREEMPPFSGTPEEREALARYLGDLGSAAAGPSPEVTQ